MANYDSTILQQYADDLYGRARMTMFLYTVVASSAGLAASFLLLNAGWGYLGDLGALHVASTIVAGVVGFLIGRSRAFNYKLQAQVALCQMQIEQNTRKQA